MKRKKLYELSGPGGRYRIHENGNIQRTDMQHEPSGQWRLLGLSYHHWCGYPTWTFTDLKRRADAGEKTAGYVWDVDHGTIRQWRNPRGKYTFMRLEEKE